MSTLSYAKFIEKYGNVIEENEEKFNDIVATKRAEKGRFRFESCEFTFKFDGRNSERMLVQAWKKNPTKPASKRKTNANRQAKERESDPKTSTQTKEKKSIKRLLEIIDNTKDSNLDIKIVGLEGCHVDLGVSFKDSDNNIWVPIQIKASNAKIPKFKMDRYKCPDDYQDKYEKYSYYEYMLTICYNMKDDNFLIIPPNSNDIKTGLEYDSKIAKKYKVKKKDIVANITEYINNYLEQLGKTFRELQFLCYKDTQLELKHIHLRIDTLSNIFDMEEISGCCVDFIIDGSVKVQEKTKNHREKSENSFKFELCKNEGHSRYQQYDVDDNDFYWFNLAGTDYFYMIPSKLLEKDGKIRKNLTLHKEFNSKIRGVKYNDSWTYDFQFNRKLIQENDFNEINRLWNLVYLEV
tara:strand:- start:563 stop:1786 length:1224 start_codon:yes stop_codon:yes gene_type:complete